MLRSFSVAVAFVSVFSLLTGCGGGGSSAGSTGSPTITLSASSLTFPNTAIGQTSAVQTVTVTNTGTASASISNLTVTGITGSSPNFAQTSNTCSGAPVLAAGSFCTLNFTFNPTAAGTFTLTITATDNASNSPQTLTLTGTGTALPVPAISLSASATAFPSTAVGQTTQAQAVVISNTGGAAATISAYTLTGNTADFTQTSTTCTGTLAASSTCTINYTFNPVAAGNFSITLSVTDNATGSPQTITLTGTGTAAPQVTLTASTLTFSGTTSGTTSAAQTVMLTNSGNASLTITGIALGGINSTSFGETTTCTGTLAASATCNISATFSPAAASTTYTAAITITDNANNVTGSTQIITLTGTSASATPGPMVTLSASTITFSSTLAGTTTASQSVTLTNTGTTTLNIAGIVLGGTNKTNFAETTTCGTTLAQNANCTISATFSPTPATSASYTATITLTDNSNNSTTQTITLNGTGTTSNVTHTFYVFPESDNSVTPLYALINSAQKTIDMTMYELQDTTFVADLVAACNRGVVVRVILSSSEASSNKTAYSALNNGVTNCSAVESNSAFTNTHQKTITIDSATSAATTAIMSLNLQSQYYSTTRDFAYVENDPADIAAIEATFATDYAAGGTNSSTDFSYQPGGGDNTINPAGDLIWSPTTAQADMVSIISNAKSSILLENEEMSASVIVNALVTACKAGVTVHIAMVNSSSYTSEFNQLTTAGCGVYLYPDTETGFYVHAKAVVADYGLPTQAVYMGSINYSTTSMNNNRELGVYIYDSASITTLYTTMAQDYTGKPSY